MDEIERIKIAHRCLLPSASRELSLLREAIKANNIGLTNVLDVGCGVGHTIETLTRMGAVGTGIDLNENVIAWLNKSHYGTFDFRQLDFMKLTAMMPFTLITMMAVLEHVEDDRGFLNRAHELLAQGGYLIIVVPAHSKQFCKHDKMYGHFRRYDKKDLEFLLSTCGFEVRSIYTYGLQVLQTIDSMLIKDTQEKDVATVKSSFELPKWYVALYPILRMGMLPYNLIQEPLKRTDLGNAYLAVGRKRA